jgi:PAS domain S-box-containing protein
MDLASQPPSEPSLLEDPERLLQGILDVTIDAFILIDAAGAIRRWNAQAERVFGWLEAEVVGRPLTETIVPPSHRDGHLHGLARFLQTGAGPILRRRIEVTARRRDGTEFPVELAVAPIPLGDDQVFGAFVRDLSGRNAAEEQLAFQSEILRHVRDAVVVTDRLGAVRYWSDGAARLFGYPSTEMIGCNASVLIPDSKALQPFLTDVLERGSGVAEWQARRHDGTRVWIDTHSSVMRDLAGTITGILHVGRDVTERHRAREALSEQEATLRAMFEQTAVGVSVVDWDGTFVQTNQVYRDLVGYDEADLSRMTFLEVTHPDDRQRVLASRAELKEGRRESYQLDKRFVRKDGSSFLGRITVSVLRDEAGHPRGTIGICEDISQRRDAAEQLRHFADRLREARENERIQISRRIHDELGQSLTALRLDLGWIEARLAELPALREKLQAMGRLAEATIGRIRTLATDLRPAVLDDLGLPAAIEWETQEFTRRTGIPCALDLPAEAFALDPDRSTDLFRILQEALTNVARHAQARRVGVRLRRLRREIQLQVDDDGRGITPEELGSHRSLGLLGMRERARLWKGQTEIRSLGNGGTSVVVRIPTSRSGGSTWTA